MTLYIGLSHSVRSRRKSVNLDENHAWPPPPPKSMKEIYKDSKDRED